jgi:hypothetical protein
LGIPAHRVGIEAHMLPIGPVTHEFSPFLEHSSLLGCSGDAAAEDVGSMVCQIRLLLRVESANVPIGPEPPRTHDLAHGVVRTQEISFITERDPTAIEQLVDMWCKQEPIVAIKPLSIR